MLDIKVDADATLRQFDEVQKRITALEQETSVTFTKWQTDDMHRKFPKVDGSGLSVSTEIFPRSQLRRQPDRSRRSIRKRSIVAASRPTATGTHRPILRPELFDKLKDHMIEMIKEACTWQ